MLIVGHVQGPCVLLVIQPTFLNPNATNGLSQASFTQDQSSFATGGHFILRDIRPFYRSRSFVNVFQAFHLDVRSKGQL